MFQIIVIINLIVYNSVNHNDIWMKFFIVIGKSNIVQTLAKIYVKNTDKCISS